MIDEKNITQQKLEIVYIENLVPQDHISRNIHKHIDFSFIRELNKGYYCLDNGRPVVDPYIERLDMQIKKFNFDTKYVGADAGYATNLI